MSSVLDHAIEYRLFFSLLGLFLFTALGLLFPYRKSKELKDPRRWFKNISFNFINAFIVVVFIPFTLIELSLNNPLTWFSFLSDYPMTHFLLGLLILDLVIYWQHRLFHKIDLLWRLHRFHHSDTEFDTTTGVRFHTLEVICSFFIKAFVVILFDLTPLTVLVFEIILNFSSSFNHSNIHFFSPVEKFLRWLVITPDLHRTHHSTKMSAMNSNFGFSISLWDRLFGSLNENKKENQLEMRIGLTQYRGEKDQSFIELLKQPFKN